jgi:hypothetical protein
MSDYLSILLTFVNSFDQLVKIAVRVPNSKLDEDCLLYYNEPENRVKYLELFPEEQRTDLLLVEIRFLSDIVIVNS